MQKWIWFLLLTPFVSNANIISKNPEQVNVTIYRAASQGNPDLANSSAEGIALISEARDIQLPAGDSVIEFVGVAQTIVPESARIESLPDVISETNFDYKLISPGEIIANSIGQSVRVVRTNVDTGKIAEERGNLISGPDGVVLDINGEMEALNCSGAHEKLIFDSLPENLQAKPVLSARVHVNRAGLHRIRLNYLAFGFDWSTNYVARILPDGKNLDLTAWVTLANKQDTSFLNAPVQVIAGKVERDRTTSPIQITTAQQTNQCWPIGKLYTMRELIDVIYAEDIGKFPDNNIADAMYRIAPGVLAAPAPMRKEAKAVQRDLGDYKLYALPNNTDLHAQQVKQVLMNSFEKIPFDKIYSYVVETEGGSSEAIYPAHLLLRMQNKKERGLGEAIPAGNVVIMQPNGKQTIAAGTTNIKDVPVGLPLEFEMGTVADLIVVPKILREYGHQEGKIKYTYEDITVSVKNNSTTDVNFELREKLIYEGASIVIESSPHVMQKGLPTWQFKLPKQSQVTVTYTVRSPNY